MRKQGNTYMIQTRDNIGKANWEAPSLQDSEKPQVDEARKRLANVEESQAGLYRHHRVNPASGVYFGNVLSSLAF